MIILYASIVVVLFIAFFHNNHFFFTCIEKEMAIFGDASLIISIAASEVDLEAGD